MLRSSVSLFPSTGFMCRNVSTTSSRAAKRFLQTAPRATNEVSYVPYKFGSSAHDSHQSSNNKNDASNGWARHSLPSRSFKDILNKSKNNNNSNSTKKTAKPQETITEKSTSPEQDVSPTATAQVQDPAEIQASAPAPAPVPKKRTRRTLRPRKALITLSPNAISHLKGLLDQPEPQMIRIGVRNRGCSGLTYNLEYISQPNKFDEIVEQNGVKVVIDSKALFSIVGSEMDWIDDKLSSRFVFKNPNSKGTCGCGESFMV